jgi:hypothetical protein
MFRVSFETCNAAFGETEEERRAEVARILRKVIRQLEGMATDEGVIMDGNGNKVGSWATDRSCRCSPDDDTRQDGKAR